MPMYKFVVSLILCFACTGIAADVHSSDSFGARFDHVPEKRFPVCDSVIDVTKSPYSAKGDGIADDTAAIQQALTDMMGQHKMLYFPPGTYLISKPLLWSKKNSAGREAWGKNYLQGARASKSIIKLKNHTFTDSKNPQALMWCGGFGSADWFHNYVEDLSFDVGEGNPGAIGLQFYSNNSGAIRNCRFIAGQGSGFIGLDLAHRDMNGPLLVKNCEVIGFRRGIATGRAVNSQTFEHITLTNQLDIGFTNEGQTISIRGLLSKNAVPALQTYGTMCLIDAKLIGEKGADRAPAIINFNGGRIYLRDIATSGYRRALADLETPDSAAAYRLSGQDKLGSEGPDIKEYGSHTATSPFNSSSKSLRLTVKEPPQLAFDPPSTWANVDTFGADPTGERDSSLAIQKAIDSGATTIFLPGMHYRFHSTVQVRGKARRMIGVGGMIDYTAQSKPDFRIVDGESDVVSFEHFAYIHGGIEIDTQQTIYFRSVSDCDLKMTPKSVGGELFLEDFVTHDLKLNRQKVWARQLNIENEGTHLANDASDLWVLGYKTERGGTLLETRGGGQSEILGGFSYTTTAGKLAPMFVTEDSSVFAFFSEVCFNSDPFVTLIKETQRGQFKEIKRGEGATTPYVTHQKSPRPK